MQQTLEIVGREEAVERAGRWRERNRSEERIFRVGVESLNDQELVATVLGVDVQSAERLLDLHCGELGRLFSAGSSWAAGSLSPVCRARFLAARELACRLAAERVPESDPLRRPAELARYLTLRYGERDQEILGALFLNSTGHLLLVQEIYRGTLSRTCVEPRETLKQALLVGAANIILFHNHPSGQAAPSLEDQAFTRSFGAAAALLGIPLSDHLILGSGNRWTSMRELMAW